LAKGSATSKLNILVTGASKAAVDAVEKLGGVLKTSTSSK
jgi:large subunit ribosomal protein L15